MSAVAPPFLEAHACGVAVRLRVQPAAARSGIAGQHERSDGRVALKIQVTAPPEGGKANSAVIKLLAKSWRIPKSRLTVIAGASARDKLLLVEGETEALRDGLSLWWKEAR